MKKVLYSFVAIALIMIATIMVVTKINKNHNAKAITIGIPIDSDVDGISSNFDNCIWVANPTQAANSKKYIRFPWSYKGDIRSGVTCYDCDGGPFTNPTPPEEWRVKAIQLDGDIAISPVVQYTTEIDEEITSTPKGFISKIWEWINS